MKRFICDQMCGEIARWLRVAGYDTILIDTPLADRDIYRMAIEENRFLLTRDRHFQEIDPQGKTVIYFKSEDLDEWAFLLKGYGINWLLDPFSRCIQCNTPFKKIPPPPQFNDEVPKDVKECWLCPHCNHVFWRGSHTQKMESQLAAWQQGQ